jgi:hypothetical protein
MPGVIGLDGKARLASHFDVCGVANPEEPIYWDASASVTTTVTAAEPELAAQLAVLELGWPTTVGEVTRAFRRLALERHPDTGGSDASFIQLRSAFDEVRAALERAAA